MTGEMSRTDSTQAMKSILSAYGEDEIIDDDRFMNDNISGSEDEHPQSMESDTKLDRISSSRENTPLDTDSQDIPASRKRRAGPTKLVSYGGDDIEEDSEEDEGEYVEIDDSSRPFSQLVSYDVSINEGHHSGTVSEAKSHSAHTDNSLRAELPPEPTAKCSNKLQEKILHEYRKGGSRDLNQTIQKTKDFRNPSIYDKLITFCNIDEKGTNYPPQLYNPLIWGKESCYDELAKAQKLDMERREKEKKERTKVEFVTGTKKQTPEGTVVEQKRKSKWDSQPASNTVAKPIVITTSAINPPVISTTTSSAGIKTTVISATGTLKKPK